MVADDEQPGVANPVFGNPVPEPWRPELPVSIPDPYSPDPYYPDPYTHF